MLRLAAVRLSSLRETPCTKLCNSMMTCKRSKHAVPGTVDFQFAGLYYVTGKRHYNSCYMHWTTKIATNKIPTILLTTNADQLLPLGVYDA